MKFKFRMVSDENGRLRPVPDKITFEDVLNEFPNLFIRKARGYETDCWEWTGPKNVHGYGVTCFSKNHVLAHRLSWKIHNGIIPKGKLVCHHCDNRICVNPAHLFVGTHLENNRDMFSKGRNRTPKGEQNGISKLTEKDVRWILENGKSFTHREMGKRFGVGHSTINSVLHRNTWKHV